MKSFKEMTHDEKIKYVATGNLTIGKITQIDEEKHDFVEHFTVRIRGLTWRCLNGEYKFKTREQALVEGKKLKKDFKQKALVIA